MLSYYLNRDLSVPGYYDSSDYTPEWWVETGSLSSLFSGINRTTGRKVQFSTYKEPNENTYTFEISESRNWIFVGRDRTELAVSSLLKAWFKKEHARGYIHFCLFILPS